MPKYLAFTLGPIYDTLQQAQKMREIWGASYLFSLLMRELLRAAPHTDWVLLSPYIEFDRQGIEFDRQGKPQLLDTDNGAGIYPDRCFFRVKPESGLTAGSIQAVVDSALSEVGRLLNTTAEKLQPFFRIYATTLDTTDSTVNAILQLNQQLDALELRPAPPLSQNLLQDTATEDGLVSLVENHIYALQKEGKVSLDQFVRFGVPNGNGFKYYRYRLPNTTEVALRELAYQEDGKLDSEYRKQIEEPFNQAVLDYESQRAKELSTKERRTLARKQADAEHAHFVAFKRARDDFRFRHKYLCFVKADGDNMGKVIQAIGNASGDLQQLSKILAEFAQAAVNEILAFGGIPIYAGGDDLFFVAPVQNERQAHILQLIKSLDEAFPQQALIRLAKQHQPGIKDLPSLSFGLSLTYHKYPMAEALENVDTLLLENAKQFELPGGKKNAVAFRVLKHSGQAFGTTLSKAELDKLLDLIAQSRQVDFNFLTSVQHKLADTKVLFEDALQHDVLPYYFEHHFNESVHQDNTFLQAVQAFCQLTYQMRTKDFDQVVYPALRFLQFLNQQDHD